METNDKPRCFIIVIRDNEASEYYYNYVESSWTDSEFVLERFDAITPNDLQYLNELNFRALNNQKYKKINYRKPFSETEKAVWYSHYSLWKKCVELNEPIIIIEHDVLLIDSDLNVYENQKFITYDNSFGCYYITPLLAKLLVKVATTEPIIYGPYGFVAYISSRHKIPIVTSEDPRFDKKVIQVLSRKYGLTNERYSDEDMKAISKAFNDDQEKIEKFKNNYRFLSIP